VSFASPRSLARVRRITLEQGEDEAKLDLSRCIKVRACCFAGAAYLERIRATCRGLEVAWRACPSCETQPAHNTLA
jgi:hypothetical protein